jgi:Response regulator containing a CheY-like receiver domain and a GGDEF domain
LTFGINISMSVMSLAIKIIKEESIMNILIGLRNNVYADYLGYNLRLLGHDVNVVEDGLDIVDLLFSKDWDIVIVGILVSYYNGLEILERYQKYCDEKLKDQSNFVKAKIFIVSSFYDQVSMQQAKSLGAIDYFVVPLDTDELLNNILKK